MGCGATSEQPVANAPAEAQATDEQQAAQGGQLTGEAVKTEQAAAGQTAAEVPQTVTGEDEHYVFPSGAKEHKASGSLRLLSNAVYYPDDSALLPDGTVELTGGETLKHVDQKAPDGGRENADHSFSYPNGDIWFPSGAVLHKNGLITNADGSIRHPSGAKELKDKTIIYPDGSARLPDGKIQFSNGDVGEAATPPAGGEAQADGSVKFTENGKASYWFPSGSKMRADGSLLLPNGSYVQGRTILSVSCTKLPQMDDFDKSDPVCILFTKANANETKWHVVGQTEVLKDNHEPIFARMLTIDQNKLQVTPESCFKIAVYDADENSDGKFAEVRKKDEMGSVQYTFKQMQEAKEGSLTARLIHRKTKEELPAGDITLHITSKQANLSDEGAEVREMRIAIIKAAQKTLSELKIMLGCKFVDGPDHGTLITDIHEGSPAEYGGLKDNDIVTHINNKPTGSNAEFKSILLALHPGDTALMNVERGDEKVELFCVIGCKTKSMDEIAILGRVAGGNVLASDFEEYKKAQAEDGKTEE